MLIWFIPINLLKADLVNTITDTVSGIKQTFTYDNEDQLTDYVVEWWF